MSRVAVVMIRDRGANYRGDKVLFSEDTARRLAADGICYLLDESGQPIVPANGVVDVAGDSPATGPQSNPTGPANQDSGKGKKPKSNKGKPDVNPFEIDGLDVKVIAALADAGITSPDDLRAYVAGGKKLTDLPSISSATEKELLELYSE